MQEARRELARHYLLHSSLELNETAYLLGYEDAHSFFRAFHDWEGSPPGEWRARHARRAADVRPRYEARCTKRDELQGTEEAQLGEATWRSRPSASAAWG